MMVKDPAITERDFEIVQILMQAAAFVSVQVPESK